MGAPRLGRLIEPAALAALLGAAAAVAPGLEAWVFDRNGTEVARAGTTAAGIVDAVVADVASFRGRAEPSDDLTLLVVRRQPVAPG
jgi:Stage II sporulation protein E (SpoIIE)